MLLATNKSSMKNFQGKSIKPEVIATERLILRSSAPSDLLKMFEGYCGDPECSRYLVCGRHTSLAQTQAFLENWCGTAWHASGKSFAWVIAERASNCPIGAFTLIQESPNLEIHFGIAQSHWGKGLVAEAGAAVLAWLQRQDTGRAISTICDSENLRSSRVLEKLGFIRDEQELKYVVMPECGTEPRCCHFYRLKT